MLTRQQHTHYSSVYRGKWLLPAFADGSPFRRPSLRVPARDRASSRASVRLDQHIQQQKSLLMHRLRFASMLLKTKLAKRASLLKF